MSKSVFNRRLKQNKTVDEIIDGINDTDNPDMDVSFKGYMHGGQGFKLQVNNLETITDYTVSLWRSIVEGQGLRPLISTNIMNGTVDISCTPPEKRRNRCKYINSLVYLSMTVFFIYYLWNRHLQRHKSI